MNDDQKVLKYSKYSALGDILDGLIHEINNRVTAISSQTYFLKKRLASCDGLDTQSNERFKRVTDAVARIGGITEGMRKFSQPDTNVEEEVDLHYIIVDAITLLERGLKNSNINLKRALNAKNRTIFGDLGKCREIILNVLGNAKYLLKECDGGTLTLTTQNVGHYLILEMHFENVTKTRLQSLTQRFRENADPTKAAAGLKTSVLLAQSMKGDLVATKEATLALTLPTCALASEGNTTQVSEADDDDTELSGSCLLIDDEENILEAIADFLEDAGMQVTPCTSGITALKHLEKQHYDLIVTDLNMPELSKEALVSALLQKASPHTKLIVVTGDTAFGKTSPAKGGASIDGYLYKPFSIDALQQMIADLLKKG